MRHANRWTVGEWTFYEMESDDQPEPLYAFGPADQISGSGLPVRGSELYPTLEHAMAAAIAEKHTGPRGAGGSGVGTAADWFMKMLGVYDLKPAGQAGTTAMLNAFEASDGFPAVGNRQYIERIEQGLETRGYRLARVPQ